MPTTSSREGAPIALLLVGLLCLWGGCFLVRAAVQAGPHGQVAHQSEAGITKMVSARAAMREGLVLGAGGAIGVIFGLSRLRLR